MSLPMLRRRRLRRARLRKQAIDRWERTGRVEDRREAGRHGRAMRYLKKLIERRTIPQPVSAQGLAFIAEFEGFYPAPYNDPAGYATVGYGHLIGYRPVQAKDHAAIWVWGQKEPGRLTRQEARRLLRSKIAQNYQPAVTRLFEKDGPLYGKWTQHRFDALVSFAFNLGPGAVTPGTKGFETIGRAIRAGDLRAIGDAMLLYDKAGGKALPGLTRRRTAERRLFLTGNYRTD